MRTYQTLRTAVNNYALRDDYPFDEFLALTESAIAKSLRVNEMLTEKVTRITTAERKILKPTGLLEIRTLKQMSKEDDFDHAVSVGFRVQGNDIVLNQTLEDTWLVMEYYDTQPAITANNVDNEIIKNYPEIYLYGVLANLYKWSQDEEQYAKYMGDTANEIILANETSQHEWSISQDINVSLQGVNF